MPTDPLNFTESRVKRLPTPESQGDSNWYQDSHKDHTSKLRLRVSYTGTRSWYYLAKIAGVTRRISIGEWPTVNVDKARKVAAKHGGKIADGIDPHTEKQQERAENTKKSLTLKDALELHLANKAHMHSERTVKEYNKVFDSKTARLTKWHDRPVIRITENMVEAWFRSRLAEAPAAAAVEGRYLRAIFNTAIAEHKALAEHGNPCAVISRKSLWPNIQARKSYVKPKQMTGFLNALENLSEDIQKDRFGDAKDYLRFLLFSGCRVEETSKLQPGDINIDDRIFILRDPKNRQKNTELPLNDELLKIAIKRLEIGDDYLFADATGTKPMQTPRKAINAIRKSSKTHFTPHDLRRTFRTAAAKIALPMKIGMQLVNHSISGELKVDLDYIQIEPEELLDASNLVAAEILRQAELSK